MSTPAASSGENTRFIILISCVATIGLASAYGMYTAVAMVSVYFVLRYVHETKGKELEQMQG